MLGLLNSKHKVPRSYLARSAHSRQKRASAPSTRKPRALGTPAWNGPENAGSVTNPRDDELRSGQWDFPTGIFQTDPFFPLT